MHICLIDWGSILLLYIGIVLDLAVGVATCKASVLLTDWGVHLHSIYMHCSRSNSGCKCMQDICAQLTGEDLCWIALWYANIFGVAVFNASMLDWTGRSICLLYICIVLDLAVGVAVCKASMLNWQGGHLSSIYMHCPRSSSVMYWVVCKSSMLEWLGDPMASIYMHCPRSISGCSIMQGIYAWLTWEVHLPSIYMHCPRSSSGCSSIQGICAQLNEEGHMKCNGIQCIYAWLTGWSICLLYICIVLDLAMGVAVYKASVLDWLRRATWSVMVFKASLLNWLGGPSAFYIYALF